MTMTMVHCIVCAWPGRGCWRGTAAPESSLCSPRHPRPPPRHPSSRTSAVSSATTTTTTAVMRTTEPAPEAMPAPAQRLVSCGKSPPLSPFSLPLLPKYIVYALCCHPCHAFIFTLTLTYALPFTCLNAFLIMLWCSGRAAWLACVGGTRPGLQPCRRRRPICAGETCWSAPPPPPHYQRIYLSPPPPPHYRSIAYVYSHPSHPLLTLY